MLKTKLIDYMGDSDNIEDIYQSINIYKTPQETRVLFCDVNNIIYSLLEKYGVIDSEIKHFKEDVDVIFVFDKITIKIFKQSKNVSIIYDKLNSINPKSNHIEQIFEIIINDDHKLLIVVSKTIIAPIAKEQIKKDYEKIREDIIEAIEILRKNNISHRDVSIDNSGYDEDTNSYVLFDFGSARVKTDQVELSESITQDYNSLDRSIRFNLTL